MEEKHVIYKIRYRIQTLVNNCWVNDGGTFKFTNDLDYFIRIIESNYDNKFNTFKFKRGIKWRIFDYVEGKVVYE